MAAHRSWAYTVLRTSIFDEDFTYGMGATWRTYFAHLGRIVGNNGGGCGQPTFLVRSSSSLIAQLLAGGGESSSHGEPGPLYIGLLVPTRRGFGILTNLSPTRIRIIADKANLRRG
jgi:hypothetical protein